jgi:hypothetical protein
MVSEPKDRAEGQALQRQRIRSGRTERVALTHKQRGNPDFQHWRICQSPGRVFDLGSNCAVGMRMRPVVAHVKRVTIRARNAFLAGRGDERKSGVAEPK